MMTLSPGPAATALALLLALVAGTLTAHAQDKPGVVETDLGDGFRAVSVNGGPPAIIDTQTGLILKQVYGRPAVVDQKAGALMIMGDDGEPVVKYYGAKGGKGDGGTQKKLDPKTAQRMKSFLGLAKKYGQDSKGKGGKDTPKKDWPKKDSPGNDGAKKKTSVDPVKAWDALIARYLKLLGVSGDEAAVVRPLLESVLRKQDEIRRSAVHLAGSTVTVPTFRPNALPAGVASYLRTFRSMLKSDKGASAAELEKGLPAYRAARKTQDTQLAALRTKLREVLTAAQEAKLAAAGVLD